MSWKKRTSTSAVQPLSLSHYNSGDRPTAGIYYITLNPSLIVRALGATAFLLVLASIGGQLTKYLTGHGYVYGLVPLFYLDSENNIPSFFSALLMLFAALLLMTITRLKTPGDPYWLRWGILSCTLLAMAVDEAASMHELLTMPIRKLLGNHAHGIFYFAWVIPGIAVVLIIGLLFPRFVLHLPPTTRTSFLIAVAVFIGGAIGVEMIGGRYAELYGEENLTYSMMVTLEESFEMVGLIIFIHALLKYLKDKYEEVNLRFEPPREPPIDGHNE